MLHSDDTSTSQTSRIGRSFQTITQDLQGPNPPIRKQYWNRGRNFQDFFRETSIPHCHSSPTRLGPRGLKPPVGTLKSPHLSSLLLTLSEFITYCTVFPCSPSRRTKERWYTVFPQLPLLTPLPYRVRGCKTTLDRPWSDFGKRRITCLGKSNRSTSPYRERRGVNGHIKSRTFTYSVSNTYIAYM